MTLLYLLTAFVAAVLFYLASPRQQFWPVASNHIKVLRILASFLSLLAWLFAGLALGL